MGLPGWPVGKESACNVGDLGSISELWRSPGHGNPLQYSCLENPHGQRSLVGYSLWGLKELDMTEWLSTAQHKMGSLVYPMYFWIQIRSDQISRSVVSDSLRPHELQHARPPCPSPTPGVHWDSRPSSQWCHPAISSSVIPFCSCP